MNEIKNLKEIGEFLIEHQNEFNNDEMFGIIFPVVCNKLNKLDNLDEIFDVFFEWWNKHLDYRLISDDIDIANKFIIYYNGIYQLKLIRKETIKRWIAEGLLNEDETVKDEYVEQGRLWYEILENNGR